MDPSGPNEYPNINAIAYSRGGYPELRLTIGNKEPPPVSLQATARDMLIVLGEVESVIAGYLVRNRSEELRLAKVAIGMVITKAYGIR